MFGKKRKKKKIRNVLVYWDGFECKNEYFCFKNPSKILVVFKQIAKVNWLNTTVFVQTSLKIQEF